jgi:hypothetical protein
MKRMSALEVKINTAICCMMAILAHQLFLLLTVLEEIEAWGQP